MTSLSEFYYSYSDFEDTMPGMKHFHVHIYFDENCLLAARTLRASADQVGLFELVKFHEQPVGPHSTGMIEAHFCEPAYTDVLEWVEANRGIFSVLIHQDTGDDYKDHTDGIRWLGKELPLKFDFFELILGSPELRIHQPKTPIST